MRPIMLVASFATTIGGFSAAFAQQVIEVYPDDPPYYEEYVQSPPRAFRYRSDAPRYRSDAPVVVPARPANCGEFRYWNGYRCVDARVVPPDVR